MIELTEADFQRLAAEPAVRQALADAESDRVRARRFFRLYSAMGTILSLVILVWLSMAWNILAGIILAVIAIVLTLLIANEPFARAQADLKGPVVDALCAQHGLQYQEAGFDPPGLESARNELFGRVSSYSFHDLVWGSAPDGRRFAFYEASLSRRDGKKSTTLFGGTIYAVQRRQRGIGTVTFLPDRGWLNMFSNFGDGLQSVPLNDPELDAAYEVRASDPNEAVRLAANPELRAMLLTLRQGGKCFVYFGPEDVVVAETAPNRFEPGSLRRPGPGEARIRQLFDDVAAALGRVGVITRAGG